MARSGGTMSIPYPDFVAGQVISSSQVDANNADIVSEITNSIAADGQTTPSANLPMGGFKHTGLGAGSAATDSAHLGQVQAQAYIWGGTAGGTQNALTFTPTPAITAYAAGQLFRGKIGSSSTNNTVTLAVSGLATKAVQSNGSALSSTVFLEANKWYDFLYDGTQFQARKYELPDGVYQPLDATLTAIAALSGLTDNRLVRTDSTVGLYQQSGITVDDSNNVSGMGTLGCGAVTSTGAVSGTTLINGLNSRVSVQFDKTNNTLASITGLSATLLGSTAYNIRCVFFTSHGAGGGQFDFNGGTATATTFKVNATAGLTTGAIGCGTSNGTALNSVFYSAATTELIYMTVDAFILTNGAGTFIPRFAQNTSSGTSSVLVGSTMCVTQIT